MPRFFDSKSFTHYSLCRKSVLHKKINYDLLLGKLHMNDLQLILNPDDIKADYIPNKYNIIVFFFLNLMFFKEKNQKSI